MLLPCLLLVVSLMAVPVDPQWQAIRSAAENMLAPYRDLGSLGGLALPLEELRYPGRSPSRPRNVRQQISQVVPGYRKTTSSKTQPFSRDRRQFRGNGNSYNKQSTFSLLKQLISETANETRVAFNQIGQILGSQFGDAATPPRTTTTTPSSTQDDQDAAGNMTTTTTEAPFRLSRQELLAILQRNAIGIGRLFRREYDQAIQDSKVNANRFKQEFSIAVAPFLAPATTEPTTTTTSS